MRGMAMALLGAMASALPCDMAAAQSADLTVSATVSSSCAISAATLAFGSYVSGQTVDRDVETTMSYSSCPLGTVSFNANGGQSGDTAARAMSSGADSLSYQLYRDAARTSVWSTGTSAISTQVLQAGASGDFTIYGRIPAGQTVADGSYSDTVTVTVSF